MQTMAIRDLKNNPSNMTHYLEEGESVFVTKHGKPIGITIPINDDTFSIGIKKLIALEQYKKGLISLGKMAELLDMKKNEAIRFLDSVKVDWLDYTQDELDEQVSTIKEIIE